jgi:hypothetical protein
MACALDKRLHSTFRFLLPAKGTVTVNLNSVALVERQINQQMAIVAEHLNQITERLDMFSTLVDSLRRNIAKRAIWQRFLKCMKQLFKIGAALFTVVAAMAAIGDPGLALLAAETLGICTVLIELFEDTSKSDYTKLRELLTVHVPGCIRRAEGRLGSFKSQLLILRINAEAHAGKVVKMHHVDAREARKEWKRERLTLERIGAVNAMRLESSVEADSGRTGVKKWRQERCAGTVLATASITV